MDRQQRQDELIDAAFAAALAGNARIARLLLADAVAQYSAPADAAISRGWRAMAAQDWPGAARWWAIVRQSFPVDPTAYLDGGICLQRAGQLAEADVVLAEGSSRFPAMPDFRLHHVWGAVRQRAWAEVASRSERARNAFPDEPRFYIEGAIGLRESDRALAADDLLRLARRQFPANVQVAHQYAENADRLVDRREALNRWAEVCRHFPNDAEAAERAGKAAYEARLGDLAAEDSAKAPPAGASRSVRPADAPAAEIIARCEGLGDDCEFGFVQRHYGIEPLSLLRWAMVTPERLIAGLDSGFEGLGDRQFITVTPNPAGELMIADHRYFEYMHSHAHKDTVDYDRFMDSICQRLTFLRRKLVADLQDGQKLFVYKRRGVVSPQTVTALDALLSRYGANMLLCAPALDRTLLPGKVRRIGDHLAIGQPPATIDLAAGKVDFNGWLRLCTRAQALFGKGSRSQGVLTTADRAGYADRPG